MKYYTLLLIFTLIGCNTKPNFELEILTKEISYLDVDNYKEYFSAEKKAPKESQTVITYKLTNNTDDSYYFNISDLNRKSKTDNYIQIDKAFIAFLNKNENLAIIKGRYLENYHTWNVLEYLDYERANFDYSKNFIIHPHETLYFEWFLVLPFGTFLEDIRYYIDLNKEESYSAELFLNSDGINYKNRISRTDLKTIEENGYKVFNGTLKAKNKIPVVFKPLNSHNSNLQPVPK